MTHLPPDFTARPATPKDLARVVEVINAHSMATTHTERINVSRQKRSWEVSGIELDTDSQLVSDENGRIVAYNTVQSEEPFVTITISVTVHPVHQRQGINAFLLDWAENRAHAFIAQAPEGAQVQIHSQIFDSDENSRNALLAHQYQLARRYVHLQVHLDAPPPPPVTPEDITIRPVGPKDWSAVFTTLEDAFRDHWGVLKDPLPEEPGDEDEDDNSYDKRSEESKAYFNTPGLCFMALARDEVVGSALCNAKVVEFPGAGKLGSLSIRRPWRRKGIGEALTSYAFEEFYRRGIRHIITDTDAENFTKSYLLYAKMGMKPYRYEEIYEKIIRPGQDWLRRSL